MDFLIEVYKACGRIPNNLIIILICIAFLLIFSFITEAYYEKKSK